MVERQGRRTRAVQRTAGGAFCFKPSVSSPPPLTFTFGMTRTPMSRILVIWLMSCCLFVAPGFLFAVVEHTGPHDLSASVPAWQCHAFA
jgi:hypothetical protein